MNIATFLVPKQCISIHVSDPDSGEPLGF